MKLTQVLLKQHIGRAFRRIWQTQRKLNIHELSAKEMLTSHGFSVQNALDVAYPKVVHPRIHIEPLVPRIKFDNTHPDWKDRACLLYKDFYPLQEGISQACLLTKTLKLEDKLPQRIEDLMIDVPPNIDSLLQRSIYTHCIYDAEQVKLPKLKDPKRPAWVFPRLYGISSTRKMRNLSRTFLQFCESISRLDVVRNRYLVQNGIVSTCVDNESDLIKPTANLELMITSLTNLTPILDPNTDNDIEMPNIYPLHHTIGLYPTNIYKTDNIYPLRATSPSVNIHTIFVNYDSEEVKNLSELPITEDQIYSRSLMNSFTAAATCARVKFGSDVRELPEPITVQCVQSDGQKFHFSVFQLNTLNIDGTEGIKNFWWSEPFIKLYENAGYVNGRPLVEGYNVEVFKRFLAFYKNR